MNRDTTITVIVKAKVVHLLLNRSQQITFEVVFSLFITRK